jgi:Ser/Thr protein kinase RdoA (MazF antagonist)
MVWRDDKLVGLIDFDHARPGAAVDDVAYALRYIAPFYDDDECLRWLRFQHAPNRRERILTFIRAYGLDDNEDWVALGLQTMRRTREVCARLADLGIQPRATSDLPTDVIDRAVDARPHRYDRTARLRASLSRFRKCGRFQCPPGSRRARNSRPD